MGDLHELLILMIVTWIWHNQEKNQSLRWILALAALGWTFSASVKIVSWLIS